MKISQKPLYKIYVYFYPYILGKNRRPTRLLFRSPMLMEDLEVWLATTLVTQTSLSKKTIVMQVEQMNNAQYNHL